MGNENSIIPTTGEYFTTAYNTGARDNTYLVKIENDALTINNLQDFEPKLHNKGISPGNMQAIMKVLREITNADEKYGSKQMNSLYVNTKHGVPQLEIIQTNTPVVPGKYYSLNIQLI